MLNSTYGYDRYSFAATQDVFISNMILVSEQSDEEKSRSASEGVFYQGHLVAVPLDGKQSYTVELSYVSC